jgi:RNA 2',3'-cyclic 3'-phosphodiesterase
VRLFVAVDLAERDRPAPDHVTLAFLGTVDAARAPAIASALRPVAAETAPFEVLLAGLGAFPSRERPRVVWQGVDVGAAELEALARRTRAALRDLVPGVDRDRFVPHLTLFRVRSPRDRQRARDLFDGVVAPPPPRRVRVEALRLKESELTPTGARHGIRDTFPLGA